MTAVVGTLISAKEVLANNKRDFEALVREYKRDATQPDASADAITCYLGMLSSEQVAGEICKLFSRKMHSPDIFWRVVLLEWGRCDCAWYSTKYLQDLFEYYRKQADVANYYAPDDRAAWDALPDPLTIYRGCDAKRVKGLSWTTDRRVAFGFARGLRGTNNRNPVLAKAIVPKSEIFFICNDRKESEVVTMPRCFNVHQYTKRSVAAACARAYKPVSAIAPAAECRENTMLVPNRGK